MEKTKHKFIVRKNVETVLLLIPTLTFFSNLFTNSIVPQLTRIKFFKIISCQNAFATRRNDFFLVI